MIITFERHSFFEGPKGENLRFSEHAPDTGHEERQICNCTREVGKRPEGEPYSVRQDILFASESFDDCLPWEWRMGSMWLTFRWGPKNSKGVRPHDPHAYFMFGCTAGDGRPHQDMSVKLEITEPNADKDILKRAFFGTLFLGNKIDTSRLMNGHSPSRIIDLSKIGPEDVWMHECNWGKEAMALVKEPDARIWRDAMLKARLITRYAKPYLQDTATSVSEVHDKIMHNQDFQWEVDDLRRKMEPFASSIQKSEVYRVCEELQKETGRWQAHSVPV